MSSKSHLHTEKELYGLIEKFLSKLEQSSEINSGNIEFLSQAHEVHSKTLDPSDHDMVEQLKRCKRGISRYEKIQSIQDELQKNLRESLVKLKDL